MSSRTDVCVECRDARLKSELAARQQYSRATIYVRLLTSTQPTPDDDTTEDYIDVSSDTANEDNHNYMEHFISRCLT